MRLGASPVKWSLAMLIRKRLFACLATLMASALNSGAAAAADSKPATAGVAAPKAAPGPAAPAAGVKPEAAIEKPKAKPHARPVAGPVAAANDAAARLQRVEAALRDAGLLPASQEAREAELATLRERLKKLEDQQRNLQDAIHFGLDPESVKPVLAELEKKTAETRQRIANLEAQRSDASESGAPARFPQRLEALETAVTGLQAAQPATPAVATPTSAPSASAPAAPAASAEPPKATQTKPSGGAGWKDGFFIESADGAYSLKPSAFVDLKFAYAGLEDKHDEFAFSVPYARLAFKGTLFTKSFKYNFTTDFPKGNAQLTYFYGDYTFVPDFFAVRAGQQKRPFSRLYIGPSEKSQFISASATVKAFGDATDIGIVFHNGQPRFEYALGLFNGTTSKSNFAGTAVVDPMTGKGTVTSGAFSNVPSRFQPAIVARVAVNHGKIEGYSEADFEGGPLRASLGLASFTAFDLDRDDKSSLRGTVDGLIKYEGLSVNAAGFIGSQQTGKHFRNRELEATGFVLQVGYLVTPHVEPVARYALVSPKGANNDTHELTGGLNVYFYKHALKWQNDVGASVRPGADATITDYLYESQLQLMF
jgi:Phosphate-selective porin O and P